MILFHYNVVVAVFVLFYYIVHGNSFKQIDKFSSGGIV